MLAEKVIKGGKGSWGEIPMPPNPSVTPDEANKLVEVDSQPEVIA
jgi:cytochrome c